MSLPVVSDEVRQAVADGLPVVALESTIITHGLPRPDNGEVARAAEQQIRDAGAVPATIGVIDGVATVGLTGARLDRLAADPTAVKASLRDLPLAAAKRRTAGTTVAATSFLAHRAGIRVFATGGLGGVHHGAATNFDESADLVTLAATPLAVVSSGVKSILDVAATLERLETLNIAVLGYRTLRFPGFYVADSGHVIEYSAESPEEVAAAVAARDALGLRAAVLVANPVPVDEQLDPQLHDRALAEAWEQARQLGIGGHDITPFLLDRIRSVTGGQSMAVNIAGYRNNIALAADVAAALSRAG
ncbi:pseudouridine-5'-phosphate glycosidase [Saccharopolyspora phatthalungensis]|uniref:Pseudouridine-5'-phosphate glycosidase n=1 Tax=Saccharopolyspora phatthalungensis TaxID=664693 RepID=A0A840Q8X7_9PSEU|nr:pseudouridine-5'-phosphate glycosidase [Saccharopolyspora phatthalungensis]MBB5153223.1 pseudouridine-5'-phosphate glycosidase [Saccharopolyspora phatthalungensis]